MIRFATKGKPDEIMETIAEIKTVIEHKEQVEAENPDWAAEPSEDRTDENGIASME